MQVTLSCLAFYWLFSVKVVVSSTLAWMSAILITFQKWITSRMLQRKPHSFLFLMQRRFVKKQDLEGKYRLEEMSFCIENSTKASLQTGLTRLHAVFPEAQL